MAFRKKGSARANQSLLRFKRRDHSVSDGILYKSHQVIVPTSLRPEMLRKIHKAHRRTDSSIRWARESVYWPGKQVVIRQTCSSCGVFAQYLSERPREPMGSHDIPFQPWSKVSVDLFQLNGSNYLVLVDHYSDYFELEPLQNTLASTVIRSMKGNFARYGIPEECITDNGPQFVSHEYSRFAREYGFTRTNYCHPTTTKEMERQNRQLRLPRISRRNHVTRTRT